MTNDTAGFPSDAAISLMNDVMSSGDGVVLFLIFFFLVCVWSGMEVHTGLNVSSLQKRNPPGILAGKELP